MLTIFFLIAMCTVMFSFALAMFVLANTKDKQ